MSKPVSFGDFQAARYFPELDGLRTISILLVISVHTADPLWLPLHGQIGVTVFFVISGFLITTLLLREETERGSASIGAFYIRRVFRILPVYYLALMACALLIGVLNVRTGGAALWRAFPYYLTYQNEFAPDGPGFWHTWSLAIEEKFYLLWPLVFSIGALRSRRTGITVALVVLTCAASLSSSGQYAATYAPILCGCLLAQLMHHARTYEVVRAIATTPVLLALLAVMVAHTALFETTGHAHVIFGLLVTLALPSLLLGSGWGKAVLTNRIMRHIGTRSYAVYLIHLMAKSVIDRLLAPGGSTGVQLARLALIVALSLVGAEIIYRVVEKPMIQRGRRLARKRESPAVQASCAA